jgi:hypothetical protein
MISHGKVRLSVLAVRMLERAAHASQIIRPRVRTLERTKPTIAARATKIAVQAPWLVIALSAMEMESIPEAETKIQSGQTH